MRTVLLPLIAVSLLTAGPALAFETRSFDAGKLTLEGVVGTVTVRTDPSVKTVTIGATGPADRLEQVTVRQDGDRIVFKQDHGRNERTTREDWITVTATIPAEAGLAIEDFIGEGTIGNLSGGLAIADMTSGTLKVGNVGTAAVGISGSGDVVLGAVYGALSVEINGSGDVKTGGVKGAVGLKINGSGEIEVAAVNGPVEADINGSGDIVLKSGRANPLKVDISGSGDVLLDGVATAQSISQSGSGKVKITGKQ